MHIHIEQINKANSYEGALRQVSEWSVENRTMKSYGVEELKRHPFGMLAFGEDEDHSNQYILGHAAVTEIHSIQDYKVGKIGALVVNEAFRDNGIGSKLINHIMREVLDTFPEISSYYAYVHPSGLNPFLSNGATIVGLRQPPASTGCNTIVNLTPQRLIY